MRLGTAIGRGKNIENQNLYAGDLCVRLPIIQKQQLNSSGYLVGGLLRRLGKDPNECISFSTVTNNLLITVTYNSLADFDMEVTEPSVNCEEPFMITPQAPISPSGGSHKEPKRRLVVRPCFIRRSAEYRTVRRETIIYGTSAPPPTGKYFVRMVKRDDCDLSKVKMTMLVLINDKVVLKRTKMSKNENKYVGDVVFKVNFDLGVEDTSICNSTPMPDIGADID